MLLFQGRLRFSLQQPVPNPAAAEHSRGGAPATRPPSGGLSIQFGFFVTGFRGEDSNFCQGWLFFSEIEKLI